MLGAIIWTMSFVINRLIGLVMAMEARLPPVPVNQRSGTGEANLDRIEASGGRNITIRNVNTFIYQSGNPLTLREVFPSERRRQRRASAPAVISTVETTAAPAAETPAATPAAAAPAPTPAAPRRRWADRIGRLIDTWEPVVRRLFRWM
ncbi:hypothetical protein MTO96_004866 [Rhipicephalus appendiculatus]